MPRFHKTTEIWIYYLLISLFRWFSFSKWLLLSSSMIVRNDCFFIAIDCLVDNLKVKIAKRARSNSKIASGSWSTRLNYFYPSVFSCSSLIESSSFSFLVRFFERISISIWRDISITKSCSNLRKMVIIVVLLSFLHQKKFNQKKFLNKIV